MGTWLEIQNEASAAGSFDLVRREKYNRLVAITSRPLLVYASAFMTQVKASNFGMMMAIDLTDKDGFSEITEGISGTEIDVLLHSPGGSAEAVESIVNILRNKFTNIRFIITGAAKSAATMLALSGNEIIMTTAGELGPIDPQLRVRNRYSPAGSIIEQFKNIQEDIKNNPEKLTAWIPILQEFAPSLLIECQNYIELSKTLVKQWMRKYMFSSERGVATTRKINKIAKYLNDEKVSLSHARRVSYQDLLELNAKVKLDTDLGENFASALQDVHLALMQTLSFTEAVKIFENSSGKALVLSAVTSAPQSPQ